MTLARAIASRQYAIRGGGNGRYDRQPGVTVQEPHGMHVREKQPQPDRVGGVNGSPHGQRREGKGNGEHEHERFQASMADVCQYDDLQR